MSGDRPSAEKKKKEHIVGISSDSETETEEYEVPYNGKWKKVQKGKKTNSVEDATVHPDLRPFGWRVPNWP